MNATVKIAALSCVLLLGACASTPRTGLRDVDIRASSGEPAMTVKLAEGVRWFYPGGPYGALTYAVDFNEAGVSTRVRIALDDDVTQQIAVGESSASVLQRIGPPLQKIRFDNLRGRPDALQKDRKSTRLNSS